jgi:hypothetical protein
MQINMTRGMLEEQRRLLRELHGLTMQQVTPHFKGVPLPLTPVDEEM